MTSPQSPVPSPYDVIVAGASFAGLAATQRLNNPGSGQNYRGFVHPESFDAAGRKPQISVRPELVEGTNGAQDRLVEGTNGAQDGPVEGRAIRPQPRFRVLLIDKDPLGAGVTSACGAPLSLVESVGGGAVVQQVHTHIYVHTPAMRAAWPLPEPFCTFDYPRFCELAYARTSAEFRQTAVLGRIGATVRTAAGNVSARFLVDATGWRAALVGGPSSPYVNRRWMAFGIETEVTCRFDDGLHFYFIPEIADGYAWIFPCGGTVRIGVLSYLGRTNLRPALDRFLARFGLRSGEIHGGFLASGLRDPVRDGVFVAGDASGQCLPMTGEGIRTAILAGWRCGELIQQVLDGSLSVADAAHAYRGFVDRSRRNFRALLWGNLALLALPLSMKGRLAAFLSRPGPLRTFMKHYLGIFSGSVLDLPIAATSR